MKEASQRMTNKYKRGRASIAVYQLDGFGKNPSLWIGTENKAVKVASFGSPAKAELFRKWLEYILGLSNDAPEVKQDERRKRENRMSILPER